MKFDTSIKALDALKRDLDRTLESHVASVKQHENSLVNSRYWVKNYKDRIRSVESAIKLLEDTNE